jgi:hypothetical protein
MEAADPAKMKSEEKSCEFVVSTARAVVENTLPRGASLSRLRFWKGGHNEDGGGITLPPE